MTDRLRSHWSIPQVLAYLTNVRRTDDDGDLLACRLQGQTPSRSVFVYLYGDDSNLIHFDLEDEAADTDEWDHAVHRGSVSTLEDLAHIVTDWLNPGSSVV